MRHLLKSLFICLVLTSGVAFSLAALAKHSFFSPIINQITFVCILFLLAAIWLAFFGEIRLQRRSENGDPDPTEPDVAETFETIQPVLTQKEESQPKPAEEPKETAPLPQDMPPVPENPSEEKPADLVPPQPETAEKPKSNTRKKAAGSKKSSSKKEPPKKDDPAPTSTDEVKKEPAKKKKAPAKSAKTSSEKQPAKKPAAAKPKSDRSAPAKAPQPEADPAPSATQETHPKIEIIVDPLSTPKAEPKPESTVQKEPASHSHSSASSSFVRHNNGRLSAEEDRQLQEQKLQNLQQQALEVQRERERKAAQKEARRQKKLEELQAEAAVPRTKPERFNWKNNQ